MNLVYAIVPWLLAAAAEKHPPVEKPSLAIEAGGAKEITILQALRDRRVELDNREAAIKAREDAYSKLKKEVDERIENTSREIAKLEARLNMGEPARQAKEKRIVSLVDALTTLSAKKAAPMLAAADPALVGELLVRLGPQRAAALLSVMPPTQAGHLVDQVGEARALAAIKAQEQAKAAAAQKSTPAANGAQAQDDTQAPGADAANSNPADASADNQGAK